ncbi:unnamed protein product [Adineta steineri]|uniref:B box-type domain-containing protein n=1 Tax=Adineta steineri TaxID=433720 RepID=A0A819IPE0_9BILA|nr:unnamed protein product [Adineta steineri]CAF3920547.1 unnamed protein product [Adineta steineri]
MSTRHYFDRTMPRNSLGGFYTSASSDNRGAYSLPSRRYVNSYSGHVRERSGSVPRSPSISQMSSPHYQSSLDLVASSLKCDDCRTNDGLFQCCHCDQRLCIQCCNKHYKNITVELERLHELSDRLVAKILHAKNDLERQKNEALEQCHKWRVDTISTINKAHTLIVQTIHDEYETLGKEYESFVQKGMAHIHVDQHELMRMKKSNINSLLSSSSTDSTNAIDTIRKRIDTFAKTIDETGRFSFQVRLPTFYIDDNLRVESRFGDVTRSTSATWKNESTIPSSSFTDRSTQGDEPSINAQSTQTDMPSSLPTDKLIEENEPSDNNQPIENDISDSSSIDKITEDNKFLDNIRPIELDVPLNDSKKDMSTNADDQIIEISDKLDTHVYTAESQAVAVYPASSPSPSPSPKFEIDDTHPILRPSTRYALSIENNVELQQQQYFSPNFRGERYDSRYGTVSNLPNISIESPLDNHSLSLTALNEQPSKKRAYPLSNGCGSFNNNRQPQTQPTLPRPLSPNFPNNDPEDAFRSISYVQLKREQDGSLEGIAIQIEQSQQTNGKVQRRRTCMESCGVRRRTTILPPRCPSSNRDRSLNDPPGISYRPNSSPASIN